MKINDNTLRNAIPKDACQSSLKFLTNDCRPKMTDKYFKQMTFLGQFVLINNQLVISRTDVQIYSLFPDVAMRTYCVLI